MEQQGLPSWFISQEGQKSSRKLDDREVDSLLTFVLNELSNAYPNQSKQITQKASRSKELGKLEKKKLKVRILIEEHKGIFEDLSQKLLNAFSAPKNPLGYSASSFMQSVYLLVKAEPVGGSYGSKYGPGQGPVE
jgi:hypothetical protein